MPTLPDIQIGDALTAAAQKQYHRSLRGYGHVSGNELQPAGGLTVEVPSDAVVWINGAEVDVSNTGNLAQLEAHGDYPRWATIVVTDTGDVQAEHGTVSPPITVDGEEITGRQAPRPSPPVITNPAKMVYAFVWIEANASEITADDIVDRRIDARLNAYNFTSDDYSDSDAISAVESEDPLDLVGDLNVGGGAAISGSLTKGGSAVATETWASGQFAAATHDNAAHSETYAVDGDAQPPQNHDNTAHSQDFVFSTSGEYEIQKDGTDGVGVINFKTQ